MRRVSSRRASGRPLAWQGRAACIAPLPRTAPPHRLRTDMRSHFHNNLTGNRACPQNFVLLDGLRPRLPSELTVKLRDKSRFFGTFCHGA
jgi:hypothetical protein